MFDPKTKKFPYPEITDQHYIILKKNRGIVFDSNYPYVNKSPWFRFVDFIFRVLLYTIVFPAATVRMGLRIEGKENLKKHREVIKGGVVSCCNHVHMWDYIAIMKAIKPIKPYILVWADNVNGENGTLMRHVGGIPIPNSGPKATMTYMKIVKNLLKENNWLHIYSEGSMWEYYRPIRPFKKGAAYFACDTGKPVMPFAFTYRKPNFIRRHIFRQVACLTLHVGEPVFPDETLSKKAKETDLTIKSHRAVCRLAGIDPEENLYPPLFEYNKRVDYYTKTYGEKYRGSW